jgi:hypothetical protein
MLLLTSQIYILLYKQLSGDAASWSFQMWWSAKSELRLRDHARHEYSQKDNYFII